MAKSSVRYAVLVANEKSLLVLIHDAIEKSSSVVRDFANRKELVEDMA